MLGIILQIITLAFIGTYLGVTNGDTVAQIKASASATGASKAAIAAIDRGIGRRAEGARARGRRVQRKGAAVAGTGELANA